MLRCVFALSLALIGLSLILTSLTASPPPQTPDSWPVPPAALNFAEYSLAMSSFSGLVRGQNGAGPL